MIQPGRLDLAGDRWVAMVRSLSFVGEDFTDAVFAMQVRRTADTIGTPLVSLTTVETSASEGVRLDYAGTDTIANHITEGRLEDVPNGFDAADSIALSVVSFRINETTMEGLPFPDERGDDAVLAWDLHITPSGELKDKYLGGTFTVRAGVTQ